MITTLIQPENATTAALREIIVRHYPKANKREAAILLRLSKKQFNSGVDAFLRGFLSGGDKLSEIKPNETI